MSLIWEGLPEGKDTVPSRSKAEPEPEPKSASYCPECDGWDNPTCTHGRYQGPFFSWEWGFGRDGLF